MASNPNPAPRRRYAYTFLVALLALAGGGTLLGFAARWGWLLELLCHFRVQYFWALVICAIGLAFGRRWKLTAAAVVLAIVNLALIVPLYFGPPLPTNPAPTARAITLNAFWMNNDYAKTLELIGAEKPDFVLLLEVTPDWADALRLLQVEYPHWRSIPITDGGGLALYSRVPMKDLEWEGLDNRTVPLLFLELALPSGPLTVIGTHPPSPSTARNFYFRNRRLNRVAQMAKSRSGPTMILGDLNTTSWSPYFQDLLDSSGLVDSRLGFGVQGSWPGLPMILRIPIDHCLVSPEIAVIERRIGPFVGSDHRPVIVDFALPK